MNNHKKIGLVIIGHLESTRLPEKMLLPLGSQTFLGQVFDYAKAGFSGTIVFAAPHDSRDDGLAALAASKNLSVVRGHPTDIIRRYLQAAEKFDLDAIITWDGDDLFVDRECLDETARLLEEGADFVKPADLPYGTFSYGLSARALRQMTERLAAGDTDGWQKFITEIPGVKIREYR